ncbi:MAG: class II aldolase/adducin family protein [Candidatus Bathyarchaeota archaeon]|nr:class II aldolase/adducin family protein [Candidatus Bathyarchaeota archaeon]
MKADESEMRRKIVEISRRLYNRGLVAGAGGNVSARTSRSDEVLMTPSGLCKGYLEASDIIKVDLEGNVLSGKLKPTSETPMHTAIYNVRNDVSAIVHAHPPVSTGFACAGVSLDYPIFPDSIAMMGNIAMVEYITPTTRELADKVAEHATGCDALLLANHGTITLGGSLEQAYQRTEILEDFAKIVLVSKLLGGPSLLSEDEVKKIRALKSEKYRLDLVSVQE